MLNSRNVSAEQKLQIMPLLSRGRLAAKKPRFGPNVLPFNREIVFGSKFTKQSETHFHTLIAKCFTNARAGNQASTGMENPILGMEPYYYRRFDHFRHSLQSTFVTVRQKKGSHYQDGCCVFVLSVVVISTRMAAKFFPAIVLVQCASSDHENA